MIREAHVNGIKLVYREEGRPAAPPLVLLHGRTADHNDWNGITQHFAARHHVFAPDLRGHGASDYPGAYPLSEMAADVVALLDRLGLGRIVLVGHSLGAVVACLVAMGGTDRVERLVLEDPPPAHPLTGRSPVVEDDSTGFDWRMVHQTERQMVDHDPAWADGLAKITAPTLVLSGTLSPFEPDVAARIPGARLARIEVGHLVHRDARQEFLREVDAFLKR